VTRESLFVSIFLVLLAPAVAGVGKVVAAETLVRCHLEYVTVEGVFVDVGREGNLVPETVGRLRHAGREIVRFRVRQVSSTTAVLQLLDGDPGKLPEPGSEIVLVLEAGETPATAVGSSPDASREPANSESRTLRKGKENAPFVPFLELPAARKIGLSEPSDLFHGRVTLRQLFQMDADTLRDYSATHLDSSGSWLRIGGTPWAVEWSGGVSYRDGHALEETRDYQEPRFEIYRFALSRRFEDKSFVRMGRFVPRELPAVGYMDGVQGEKTINEKFRIGAVLGFKPDRNGLDPSEKEPAVAPYVTFELGESAEWRYSTTAGVLASLYEGSPDRLALLWDQTGHFGQLAFGSTSEVDVDVGGAETRKGTRFTRWNLYTSYPLLPFFTLRAGLDRYERPDTAVERDLVGFVDVDLNDDIFDRGFWRYWVGGSQRLPWRLRLSEEVSFMDSEIDDYAARWQASLTRTGLPFLSAASVTLTAYNLRGSGVEGYGGRISSYLPFMDHRFSLQPSASLRFLDDDNAGGEDFEFTDIYVRADYRVTDAWTVFAGVSHAFGSVVDRYFLDAGVTFRW